jgi:hypothetical protein
LRNAESGWAKISDRATSGQHIIVTLEKRELIKRTSGAGRSIQLLLGRDQLLDLE